jgi:hypothetical protein
MKGNNTPIARFFIMLVIGITAFYIISCQLISQTAELVKSTPSTISTITTSLIETEVVVASPPPTSSVQETIIPLFTSTSEPAQQTLALTSLTPSLSAPVTINLTTSYPFSSPTPVQIGPKVYKITIHNNYYSPLQVYIDEKYIMTIPGRKYMWFRGVMEGSHIVLLCPWQGRCAKKVINFDEDKELWTGS